MKVETFLRAHHLRLDLNPFAEEEAQDDAVFERLLARGALRYSHPAWDKFCGHPIGAGSASVYGAKGTGKTAMRIAFEACVRDHNARSEDDRVLLIKYDDFNPYLDAFRMRVGRDVALKDWTLSDHLDAVLSAGVSALLADLEGKRWSRAVTKLPRHNRRDLFLLLAMYLRARTNEYRRELLRRRRSLLGLQVGRAFLVPLAGILTLGAAFGVMWWRARAAARRATRAIRVLQRRRADAAWAFWFVPQASLRDQPLVGDERPPRDEDARFAWLEKFRNVAFAMGYRRIVVLIDRVDEPTMIQGDPARMEDFVRPLWNNKLLHLPGYSFKMLLPLCLHRALQTAGHRELAMARPDKMNITFPFEWTGVQLYEVLSDRLRVCRDTDGDEPYDLKELFDSKITKEEIIRVLDKTRQPRMAARFVHEAVKMTCGLLDEERVGENIPRVPLRVLDRAEAQMDVWIRDYRQSLGEFT